MTERERARRRARRAARELLRRWGVRSAADIRLEAIARAMGIDVIEGPLDGARARLGGGPRPVIRISDAATVPGAKRFSLAHEIGHHVLEHPLACTDTLCGQLPSVIEDPAARDREAEANLFASELLMPRALVAPRCGVRPPTLSIPLSIVEEFQTSLHASAIRFVELTSERCAIAYSERGTVVWATTSRRFVDRITPGTPIAEASVAHACASFATTSERTDTVAAHTWLRATIDPDAELIEQSAMLPHIGGVITLLWRPGTTPAAQPAAAN